MSNTRAANFTKSEENLLLSLVSKYKNILECKLSNTDVNQKKIKCWQKIAIEFNSLSGQTYRDDKVLKKKYENIKKRTTKKFADEKCYVGGTGGGPQQLIEVTDVDVVVKEILGARLTGHSSEFDDDAETTSNLQGLHVDNPIPRPPQLEENIPMNIETPALNSSMFQLSDDDNDDCLMNMSSMQTGASSREVPIMDKIDDRNIENANRNKATDKLAQWAAAKELIELTRKEYIQKEQEFKLKAMQEKHELELQIMRDKAELELEQMKEEHKMKMEILIMQKFNVSNNKN
ncbi:hypothetical protein Zmor_013189 [Zophobas morio]|uniref:Regulatory protein zeste n=1 Tax=Zophobas morio TaxID=2755281 RepID=A0AA38IF16_9CUCU|nr:hypothetical protein Zmor_013189 [Zophobas morio]